MWTSCILTKGFQDLRRDALSSLTRHLDLVKEQESKYGYRLGLKSNIYWRHLTVKYFLVIQKRMPDEKRRDLAEIVAITFDRGKTTGRTIMNWENSLVDERKIPGRDEDESDPAWMDDEDLRLGIRDFAKREGQPTC